VPLFLCLFVSFSIITLSHLKLGPPEGDVMQAFTESPVRIALSQDSLLLPLPHQPDRLVPDPLRVVPGIVRAVVVAHVGARPVRGREAGVIGHPRSL
jgi:hypothetical protein